MVQRFGGVSWGEYGSDWATRDVVGIHVLCQEYVLYCNFREDLLREAVGCKRNDWSKLLLAPPFLRTS